MSTSAGTADRAELASVVAQPTHIDVHIHQVSALAKLLLTVGSQLQTWAHPKGTATQAPGSSWLLVATWVMQSVLSILSGVLGGFLYIFRYSHLLDSGAAIWTGAVAVLAGAAAFLREKWGGVSWDGNYVCNTSSQRSWPTAPPSTLSPEEARRLHLCLSYVDMLGMSGLEAQPAAGPVHRPQGHASGCLGSAAGGISNPLGPPGLPVSVLLEKTPT
ncbi:transmembrane protein 176A [Dugong dugon]